MWTLPLVVCPCVLAFMYFQSSVPVFLMEEKTIYKQMLTLIKFIASQKSKFVKDCTCMVIIANISNVFIMHLNCGK